MVITSTPTDFNQLSYKKLDVIEGFQTQKETVVYIQCRILFTSSEFKSNKK